MHPRCVPSNDGTASSKTEIHFHETRGLFIAFRLSMTSGTNVNTFMMTANMPELVNHGDYLALQRIQTLRAPTSKAQSHR